MKKMYLFCLFILILSSLISVTKEGFGDGLLYGWGRYYPDKAIFFNQPLIEIDQNGTRAAYSSSLGDSKDPERIMELSDLENKISHFPIKAIKRKLMVTCDCNNTITGKMKDQCVGGNYNFDIQKYGNLFEELIRPKPLYTTSLLARELNLS